MPLRMAFEVLMLMNMKSWKRDMVGLNIGNIVGISIIYVNYQYYLGIVLESPNLLIKRTYTLKLHGLKLQLVEVMCNLF
jgi:hypothetical protein